MSYEGTPAFTKQLSFHNKGDITMTVTDTDTMPEPTDADVAASSEQTGELPETDAPSASAESSEPEASSLNDIWAAVDALGDNAKAEGFSYDTVVSEYEKLNRKGKMQFTHRLKAKTFAALDDDEFGLAKVLSGAQKVIGSTTSTGGAVADPTEELVNRMAGLTIALRKLTEDNPKLSDRVTVAIETGTNDAASIPGALAARLVEKKMARKPRSEGGKRHNVGRHIAQVFANAEAGTFMSVKQITEAKSEEYGDDTPAENTIKTHLESGKFEQTGLEVVTNDDTLGVLKTA